MERIVIVGASSGIGAALAVELARPGRVLGLVARREAELAAVAARVRQKGATAAMAVTDAGDTGTARPTWSKLQGELGGIDALVYAAGVLHAVGPREFDADKDLDMVRVNLSGAIAWIDLAAREFQDRGSGTICGIGSVAGDRGRQPSPVYGATKAGLHAYLESLAGRLWQDGVRVVTIKPGPVKTAMTDGRGPMPMMIDAEACARRIVLALERGEREVYVAGPWRFVMAAIRCLPWWLFKRFRK